jgi:competence protein ComEC
MRVVAAVPAGALLVGCAAGVAWPDLPRPPLLAMLAAAVAAAAFCVNAGRPVRFAAAVACGAVAAGVLMASAAWAEAWRPSLKVAFEEIADAQRPGLARAPAGEFGGDPSRASVVLVGRLRSDAAVDAAGRVSLEIEARWIGRTGAGHTSAAANPVRGGVRLSVGGTLAGQLLREWRRGRTVQAIAQLRRPGRYLDPGVPDGERALARRGIALVGSVKSGSLVTVVSHGSRWEETTATVRAFSRRAIAAGVGRWSRRSAGIVTAIVIGDRTGLEADVERELQEAGTYHVIAISGGNIAILAGLTLTVFRLAGLLGRAAMVAAIAGLLAYGSLVSGGASVDRATWMAAVYFASRALDLRGPPLNALAVVAAVLVLRQPLSVADPGFLLTAGATAAILLVPVEWTRRWRTLGMRAAIGLGLASLAAELALLPVSASFFSRVTLAGLGLNYLAIPLMAVAQVAGMVVVPVALVSSDLAAAVGWVAHLGATGLVRSAELVRLAPIVTWRVAPPATWAIAFYYLAGIATLTLWSSRTESLPRHRIWVSGATLWPAAAIWIAAMPWTVRSTRGDGRLHVTFVDVGQGDSALVRFPRGRTMLVDTGGLTIDSGFDIGDRVVGPVLREWGIRRLDTLVLTHGDADHVGGAVSVVREFRPWDVWEGVPVPPSAALQAIRAMAQRARSRWTQVQTDDRIFVDDVEIVVRNPRLPDWERQDVRNDDSIVLELRWRDVSFVLAGDIGRDVEEGIAGQVPPAALRVLKVPHHGSLTSSSERFLDRLHPTVAVVSAGRDNVFGYPLPAVLDRYGAVGAAIYRTDRDGAVTIDTDGRSLDITTFTGRRQHLGGRGER